MQGLKLCLLLELKWRTEIPVLALGLVHRVVGPLWFVLNKHDSDKGLWASCHLACVSPLIYSWYVALVLMLWLESWKGFSWSLGNA